MPRAIWKGNISFGLVTIPVSLYPAASSDELSFNQLEMRDLSPVGYKRINKKTSTEVPWDQIVTVVDENEPVPARKAGVVIDLMPLLKQSLEKATARPRRAAATGKKRQTRH
jgi:non-homologous end joining protein Ku